MPTIVHTSDTHLGHQQYGRVDPATGLNQREVDHYQAFDAVIDAALADPPDVFIHAGDLFDGVRPTNRALAHALDGFLRLSRADIPVVAIAGNHEHPKLRETGSAFRLFEHLDGVHAVYRGRREEIDVGGIRVQAVPQCADNDALRREVDAIDAHDGPQILVVHGAVHDLPAFYHAEFNELSLDAAWFDDRFDYVALGHHHGHRHVTDRAWYCGAPDRVSIAESGEEKGYLRAVVAANKPPRVTFTPLAGRVYVDLPRIEADGLDADAIRAAADAVLRRVPDGAVTRVRIAGAGADLRGVLGPQDVADHRDRLLHLDFRIDWADDDARMAGPPQIRGLAEEFETYAQSARIEHGDRQGLITAARELLAEAA